MRKIEAKDSAAAYHLTGENNKDYISFGDGSQRTNYYLSSWEAVRLADSILREVTSAIGISHRYRAVADALMREISQLRVEPIHLAEPPLVASDWSPAGEQGSD